MIEKNKIRSDEIKQKLSDILDAITIVRENLPADSDKFPDMGLIKDGLYKKIEFAIESVIDICNIINSDLRLGVPSTEDKLIDNLEKNKVFDIKIINLIREMKKFRNVLVHKYGDIDDEKAYLDIKDGLNDFELVIAEFEKFLTKRKNKK